MEVRNAFARARVVSELGGKSKTIQSEREACDINAIVRKYASTGQLEHITKAEPRYGDFTSVEDYLAMHVRVKSAQEGFQMLPAELRDRCGNDPAEFVAYLNDPENAAELRTVGLEKLVNELHGPPVREPKVPEPKADPEPEPKAEPVVKGGE